MTVDHVAGRQAPALASQLVHGTLELTGDLALERDLLLNPQGVLGGQRRQIAHGHKG